VGLHSDPSAQASDRGAQKYEPAPADQRLTTHLSFRRVGTTCELPVVLERASSVGRERRVIEHSGPILNELDGTIEGVVVDHLEGDIGVAVVDAL
jgi:hypothetical protein